MNETAKNLMDLHARRIDAIERLIEPARAAAHQMQDAGMKAGAAGKKPEPVYSPDDVATMAAAAPVVMTEISPGHLLAKSLVTQTDQIPHALQHVLSIIEKLATIAQRPQLEAHRAPERPWMTMAEAAEYTGLSQTLLRRLSRDGELASIRDGAVKVRRVDLDNLAIVAGLAKSGSDLGRGCAPIYRRPPAET